MRQHQSGAREKTATVCPPKLPQNNKEVNNMANIIIGILTALLMAGAGVKVL